MKTIELHLEDSLAPKAIEYFKAFLAQHTKNGKSNFTYIDDLGDTIEVINGVEYVIPTKEDEEAMSKPLDRNDFISLEELEKKYV